MVGQADGHLCGKLPVEVTVCPACSQGIRPSRAWTWIDGSVIAATAAACRLPECRAECPMSETFARIGRCGLIWIGENFYRSPEEFFEESLVLGISRRIARVPRNFQVGVTWIMLAHRFAIAAGDGTFRAAVFQLFRPRAIEYITTGEETSEELDALVARGITPVRVEAEEGKFQEPNKNQ